MAEHTKNKRPSTKGKHQQGQTRKKKDAGGEKGDARRNNPWGRDKNVKAIVPTAPQRSSWENNKTYPRNNVLAMNPYYFLF